MCTNYYALIIILKHLLLLPTIICLLRFSLCSQCELKTYLRLGFSNFYFLAYVVVLFKEWFIGERNIATNISTNL